ncbi:glycosyltransferase family 2 protein [Dactylosporangium aurantiacum]|uniref:Glycosyltransferase family 2 protein n=1 Tax=Dactylosporangium aurantiacum TaxID=35754 RepID=A0A9Q9ICY3_9ACTN|nr:glycosyltransferase family 2 protein [Dactylosporangium aurantiacum]MDG6102210.1 glycosyltransferase family 2 protein [Dactylosporangium aurantiacum]UWZ53476.1 glycosyltransferase family 2 protein [Dactylosporangium aurantiacum]
MSVTVSVIMPVHDPAGSPGGPAGDAGQVGRALGSVLATRVPDGVTVELLVVDDATPAAATALAAVRGGAPFPVRVLRHDVPRGRSAARNTGLAAATGDYVWFVGGDDWVDPGLLAALTSATPDADIVVAGTVPVTEDGVTGPPLPRRATGAVWTGPQAVEEFLYQRIRAGVTNKLIRRDLLDGLSFPTGPRHEDVAVMAWLLLRARTVAYVAGPAYFHLRRPVAGYDPRVADRAAAVDEALFVLAGAGSPAARLHFRLRAGALAVAGAAARSTPGELSVPAWDAVCAARRAVRPRDAWTALRHRQPLLAAGVLLIRLAPALYVRLYRAARAADRHRDDRRGRPWRDAAAAVPVPAAVQATQAIQAAAGADADDADQAVPAGDPGTGADQQRPAGGLVGAEQG